jgi:hypothetical protein
MAQFMTGAPAAGVRVGSAAPANNPAISGTISIKRSAFMFYAM